jgi:hypothetical protein
MKTRISVAVVVLMLVIVAMRVCFGYEKDTHKEISIRAINESIIANLVINGKLEDIGLTSDVYIGPTYDNQYHIRSATGFSPRRNVLGMVANRTSRWNSNIRGGLNNPPRTGPHLATWRRFFIVVELNFNFMRINYADNFQIFWNHHQGCTTTKIIHRILCGIS